jgi:hypothetical protein
VPAPINRPEGDNPVKNRAQTVFPAHVIEDERLFFLNEHEQPDQPVETTAEKQNESQPYQRTADEIVNLTHFSPS